MAAILMAAFAIFAYAAQEQNTDDPGQIKADQERSIFDEDVKEVMHQKLLELIDRTNPERGRQLRELRDTNPQEFEKEIDETAKKMRERLGDPHKRNKEPDAVTRATDKGDWNKPSAKEDESKRPETQARKGFGDVSKRIGAARDSYMELMRKRNEEFVEWLKVNYPEKAVEFEKASEANPERAFRDLMPVMMKYRDIFETEKKNPELASLMKKDIDLLEREGEILTAAKISEKEKDKEKLTAELNSIVAARFDLILMKRQMRFDELKERLAQLENEIKKQEADLEELSKQRDEQINKRVTELLSADSQIKWN